MRDSLIFATGNRHKLQEVQGLLGEDFALRCLKDVGLEADIPETAGTLRGNALQKAMYVHERTGQACFADDTGLEIDALGGEPGVYSARYAGEMKDDAANVRKVLDKMRGVACRSARFRTVIAYVAVGGECRFFEGEARGEILEAPDGDGGFGYDPIFRPEGCEVSFARLSMERKNAISHRGRALRAFTDYLKLLCQ